MHNIECEHVRSILIVHAHYILSIIACKYETFSTVKMTLIRIGVFMVHTNRNEIDIIMHWIHGYMQTTEEFTEERLYFKMLFHDIRFSLI